jgi:hypothetical protein
MRTTGIYVTVARTVKTLWNVLDGILTVTCTASATPDPRLLRTWFLTKEIAVAVSVGCNERYLAAWYAPASRECLIV